jgi:hypothetical protein
MNNTGSDDYMMDLSEVEGGRSRNDLSQEDEVEEE